MVDIIITSIMEEGMIAQTILIKRYMSLSILMNPDNNIENTMKAN